MKHVLGIRIWFFIATYWVPPLYWVLYEMWSVSTVPGTYGCSLNILCKLCLFMRWYSIILMILWIYKMYNHIHDWCKSIVPVLQIRKLRLREIKWLAHSCTEQVVLSFKPRLFSPCRTLFWKGYWRACWVGLTEENVHIWKWNGMQYSSY